MCPSEEPLLNGVNPVPDSYFTASSIYDLGYEGYEDFYAAFMARLNVGGHWRPSEAESVAIPPTLFLQVN